jgi:hypothetical protein
MSKEPGEQEIFGKSNQQYTVKYILFFVSQTYNGGGGLSGGRYQLQSYRL